MGNQTKFILAQNIMHYLEIYFFKIANFTKFIELPQKIIIISSIETPTNIFFCNYGRYSRVTFGTPLQIMSTTTMTTAAHFAVHQSSLLTSLLLTVALHYPLMTFES